MANPTAGNNSRTGTLNERSGSPDKYIKKRTKGSVLTSQERRMVLNVYGTLRKENPKWSVFDASLKASVLCGISITTLNRIKIEFSKTDGKLVTPGLTRVTMKKKYGPESITRMKSKLMKLFSDHKKPTLNYVMDEFERDSRIPTISRGRVMNMIKALGCKDSISTPHNTSFVPMPCGLEWKFTSRLEPVEMAQFPSMSAVGQHNLHQLMPAAAYPTLDPLSLSPSLQGQLNDSKPYIETCAIK